MNGERRQDIGLKVVYVILTAVITLMLSAFFYKTANVAESALMIGNENKKDIAVVQQWVKSADNALLDINRKLDTLLGWKK